MTNISDFLSSADVIVDLRASDKKALLRILAERAASGVNIPPDQIFSELCKREELGSTGIGNGVAIPHARFATLTKPFGTLVKLKEPVDFDAIDGQRVDLVFLLLLPAAEGDQLGALASISRKLRVPETLAQLRRAKSSGELYSAIIG